MLWTLEQPRICSKILDSIWDSKVLSLNRLASNPKCQCSSHSKICKLSQQVSALELHLQFRTRLKDNSCLNKVPSHQWECKVSSKLALDSLKTSVNQLLASANSLHSNLVLVDSLRKGSHSQLQALTSRLKGFKPNLKAILVDFSPLNLLVEISEGSSHRRTTRRFTLVVLLT